MHGNIANSTPVEFHGATGGFQKIRVKGLGSVPIARRGL